MIPVKASGWFNSNLTKENQEILLKEGIVPISDIFFDLWNNEDKLKLLYGSYGSGKSDFIATCLLKRCKEEKYFKGFFGRKVKDKVRDSCHSKLISIIKRHGMQGEFSYSEQPNGSLVIICLKNGNQLIPFGAQYPDDMKSVDDPTDIWMEEADQFNAEDMQILLSRLRTPKAKHHLWLSFNTAPVMPGHWILKYFFPEQTHTADKDVNESVAKALSAITCTKIFCNFIDNYFQDKEEYLNTLRFTAGGDDSYLQAIAYGAWGVAMEGLLFPLSKLNLEDFSTIPQLNIKDELGVDYIYLAGDPADLGSDSFALGIGKLIGSNIYITDIVYNEKGTLYNEKEAVRLVIENKPHSAGIEGVMGWIDVVNRIRISLQKLGYEGEVRALRPRTNKKVRISARASFIIKHFIFRKDYNNIPEYAMFMRNLTSYLADGTSKHDDAPDLCEMIASHYERTFGEIWALQ